MKILSIGNSFSQDAHRWLHSLAEQNGLCLETANLFIPGCSLETHYNNMVNNIADYELEINGGGCVRRIGLEEALGLDNWDVITVQQVSRKSGDFESYEPYLTEILKKVRAACPNAKLYFHRTWSYEQDFGERAYGDPNFSQREMYENTVKASRMAAELIGAEIIPAGDLIQYLRENEPLFDLKNGGISLCQDGFHLSFNYGRYACAALWIYKLTGQIVKAREFEDFDLKYIEAIVSALKKIKI